MTPSSSSRDRLIYLLGCGGHGRVVLDSLRMCAIPIRGILDSALTPGAHIDGVPVCGGDEYLAQLDPQQAAVCIGVGVMPGNTRRVALVESCRRRGFELISVVHPSAIIAPRHEFGVGVQVLAGAVLQGGVRLGDNVIVNTRASVDHDCVIGPDVMIGPGAVLCGLVSVAAGAYVGAGAVLLPGVRIGEHAVVGAGCTVTGDVAGGDTVIGNPARKLDPADGRNA